MIKEPKSMREVHEIMERLHEQRKGKSKDEVFQDIRKTVEMAEKKHGLQLKKIKHALKVA